jgi:hypothetical protein
LIARRAAVVLLPLPLLVARGYKIIVFFTTARLTGFMSELFNRVKVKRGERPTTTDDDETTTIPTHYDNDDDSD